MVQPVHHKVGQLFTDTVTLKCTHTLLAAADAVVFDTLERRQAHSTPQQQHPRPGSGHRAAAPRSNIYRMLATSAAATSAIADTVDVYRCNAAWHPSQPLSQPQATPHSAHLFCNFFLYIHFVFHSHRECLAEEALLYFSACD